MKSTFVLCLTILTLCCSSHANAALKAGAAKIDVTPDWFPVLVNGSMVSREATKVKTPVHARAIVVADDDDTIAIVVVDSCMMSRGFLDDVKALAAQETGIAAEDMLICATHTHTAPASMGCLGTDADPNYVPFLREKLVRVIATAQQNLEPARFGWAVANAAPYTALRRWIRRPDRVVTDPFGNLTVRANMHSGRNWDDVTGESGPEDPDLSMISFQSLDGRPIALLANFSMHYYGDQALSADYFGLYSEGLKERIAPEASSDKPEFVAMMSHGCSGDIWRRDYTQPDVVPPGSETIEGFAAALVDITTATYEGITYSEAGEVEMAETRLPLKYRVPDQQRLEWAQRIVAELGDRLPKTREEIYAREQVMLHEWQETESVIQGVRIGDFGLATTPTETYALTGLKIKKQSPLAYTMVFDLANGGDGYIPPPEQHLLGGYNTWAARSAGLEVTAEPKMVEAALTMLEQVSGKPRRVYRQSLGPAASRILAHNPRAYWRLDEFSGPRALDSSPHALDAFYEPEVVYYLEGPASAAYSPDDEANRAAHFAGGRMTARVPNLGEEYTVSMMIWNGMPYEARDVAGWCFSRGRDHGLGTSGDHLGLGGTGDQSGKLIFFHGGSDAVPLLGKSEVPRWTWTHVALVRRGNVVQVYVNGTLDIEGTFETTVPPGLDTVFFGGRCDGVDNWEGRLDEVAIFDRALSADEVASLVP